VMLVSSLGHTGLMAETIAVIDFASCDIGLLRMLQLLLHTKNL